MLVQDILGNVFDGGTFTALARIVDWNDSLLLQANVSSIHYTIYNTRDNTIVTGHNDVACTVSAVVYDTLQTTDLWTIDDVGYNFRVTIDVSSNPAFSNGDGTSVGLVRLVVFTIQPTSGQAVIVRYRVNVI